MPYIKLEDRMKYLEPLSKIIKILRNAPEIQRDGEANYIISKILKRGYNPQRYHDFNAIMGVLESVKQEFYRRYTAPYEDIKRKENGDI